MATIRSPGFKQVVGNRLQQGLAELKLPRLRLVDQRDEIDFVFLGGFLHVGLVAGDDQPDFPQVLPDRGEIEGDLGQDDEGLGVVLDGNAARGDQQAPHLLRDFDCASAGRPSYVQTCGGLRTPPGVSETMRFRTSEFKGRASTPRPSAISFRQADLDNVGQVYAVGQAVGGAELPHRSVSRVFDTPAMLLAGPNTPTSVRLATEVAQGQRSLSDIQQNGPFRGELDHPGQDLRVVHRRHLRRLHADDGDVIIHGGRAYSVGGA